MEKFQLTARQQEAQRILSGDSTHLMLFGGSRCLSGDAVLNGHTKTISELAQDGKPVWVWTTRGLVFAEAPFKKGSCALLAITLEDGLKCRVTPDHRFWDGSRWIKAQELNPGASVAVLSSEPDLLQTSSELDRPALPASDLHCRQRLAGCSGRCSVGCHQ